MPKKQGEQPPEKLQMEIDMLKKALTEVVKERDEALQQLEHANRRVAEYADKAEGYGMKGSELKQENHCLQETIKKLEAELDETRAARAKLEDDRYVLEFEIRRMKDEKDKGEECKACSKIWERKFERLKAMIFDLEHQWEQ